MRDGSETMLGMLVGPGLRSMDKLSPEARSRNMARIRSSGMLPELAVRRIVHSLGYRYRLHGTFKGKHLPGKPDLVFASLRKVIFVHGCFWHQHGDDCKVARKPKSNRDYWDVKLAGNAKRDAAAVAALKADGWRVLVVWECEGRERDGLSARLDRFLCK
jgi:DNA mismatch endonuclease (patch repair protein)